MPDITTRVKFAVRQWCTTATNPTPPVPITLETKLNALRRGGYDILRCYVNDEFRGASSNFPISTATWTALKAATVGDVRDEVLELVEP